MRTLKASFTVEMAYLMPIILILIMSSILAVFYFHDKNIIAGAAYETAVVGSAKAREKDGVKAGELETLFRERVSGKCILFARPAPSITVGDQKIEVNVSASKGRMRLSVAKQASVTKPEKYIRDVRRGKEVVKWKER